MGGVESLIAELERAGHLDAARAAFLRRVARGELVSVRLELQLLLYAGVLLVTGGVGILVKRHYDDLGPAAIAAALGLAAAACLLWTWRKSPPFARGEVPSPHLAYDYVLLLGLLLLGSWLAYVEYNFTLLGEAWPWHLLLVSLLCLGSAYRFDSRTVLTLALTTFAAWRGVAVTSLAAWGRATDLVRWNALGCALLFLALGWLTSRWEIKAHFQEVCAHLGLLLLFGALLSGFFVTLRRWGAEEYLWAAALALAVAVTVRLALRRGRVSWFAYAVVAGWMGFLRLVPIFDLGTFGFNLVAASALGVILLILRVRKQMREEDR
jgi:hypothetical protein